MKCVCPPPNKRKIEQFQIVLIYAEKHMERNRESFEFIKIIGALCCGTEP